MANALHSSVTDDPVISACDWHLVANHALMPSYNSIYIVLEIPARGLNG